MLNGIYQNAASMSGLETWNNAIAQNLAQSSTPGYKKAILSFEGQGNGMIGYEGSFDKTLFRESVMAAGKDGIDFSTGSIQNTDIKTDFAIEGEGFFELRTPEGQLIYTRDGQFRINDQGELVSKQGYHVLDGERGIIQLLPDGGEGNRLPSSGFAMSTTQHRWCVPMVDSWLIQRFRLIPTIWIQTKSQSGTELSSRVMYLTHLRWLT